MTETADFASLGPMLLARKGTAKPAMRAQLTQNDRVAELGDDFDDLAESQSDLGWNDMGDDDGVVQLHAANDFAHKRTPVSLEAEPRPRQKAADQGRRAAFTLRLDNERHLKLRLASTMQSCSAQQLVTEALDRFLQDIPELDSIAAHVAGNKTKG
ncbi:hypothetical protein GRF63_05040 [Erythrobacter sp. GH3-10]|uniref:Uncharacterized protein n=2 Tax=Aurantiacibacter rhizosphaerae TaxID=2691582 RepID=A0A844XCA4_9SPHN|nr:hypothetical protein [Aurantiacibacter rhizosphaerae]